MCARPTNNTSARVSTQQVFKHNIDPASYELEETDMGLVFPALMAQPFVDIYLGRSLKNALLLAAFTGEEMMSAAAATAEIKREHAVAHDQDQIRGMGDLSNHFRSVYQASTENRKMLHVAVAPNYNVLLARNLGAFANVAGSETIKHGDIHTIKRGLKVKEDTLLVNIRNKGCPDKSLRMVAYQRYLGSHKGDEQLKSTLKCAGFGCGYFCVGMLRRGTSSRYAIDQLIERGKDLTPEQERKIVEVLAHANLNFIRSRSEPCKGEKATEGHLRRTGEANLCPENFHNTLPGVPKDHMKHINLLIKAAAEPAPRLPAADDDANTAAHDDANKGSASEPKAKPKNKSSSSEPKANPKRAVSQEGAEGSNGDAIKKATINEDALVVGFNETLTVDPDVSKFFYIQENFQCNVLSAWDVGLRTKGTETYYVTEPTWFIATQARGGYLMPRVHGQKFGENPITFGFDMYQPVYIQNDVLGDFQIWESGWMMGCARCKRMLEPKEGWDIDYCLDNGNVPARSAPF